MISSSQTVCRFAFGEPNKFLGPSGPPTKGRPSETNFVAPRKLPVDSFFISKTKHEQEFCSASVSIPSNCVALAAGFAYVCRSQQCRQRLLHFCFAKVRKVWYCCASFESKRSWTNLRSDTVRALVRLPTESAPCLLSLNKTGWSVGLSSGNGDCIEQNRLKSLPGLPGTMFRFSELLQGNFRLLVLSKAEHAKVCAQPEGEPEWPKQGNSNLNSCLATFRLAKVQGSKAEGSQARVLAPACSTSSTARGRAGQAELSDSRASRQPNSALPTSQTKFAGGCFCEAKARPVLVLNKGEQAAEHGLLSRPPAHPMLTPFGAKYNQAKVNHRLSFGGAKLLTSKGLRDRFIVKSYKDGIDPITDEPLNTEVTMRPLAGVSNQSDLDRQLPNKADEQETRTIVITSGKGGVGKTTTTANLGMSIARLGYRVALIDADIGLRNLDLLLGLENRVLYTAMDIFEGDCRLDQALIRDKRLKNLCLLAISKNRQRYNVTRQKMDTLIASISALGYHFILIDCPAGIDIGFINAISPAQEALIVTTPEITAMRDADRVAGLLEANGIYNAKLLINRVRPDMIQRHDMMSVQDVQDVLGIPLLGAIPEDLNVIISTNRGEPLVLRKKLTLSGIAFENAARRLIGRSDYLIDLKTPYKGLFQKMKTLFFNNQ